MVSGVSKGSVSVNECKPPSCVMSVYLEPTAKRSIGGFEVGEEVTHFHCLVILMSSEICSSFYMVGP